MFSNALSHDLMRKHGGDVQDMNHEGGFLWLDFECETASLHASYHHGLQFKIQAHITSKISHLKKPLKFTQIHAQLKSYVLHVTLKGFNSGGSWDSNTIRSKSGCWLVEPLDFKSGCIKTPAFWHSLSETELIITIYFQSFHQQPAPLVLIPFLLST